jgi:hypothetical protein
VRQVDVKGHVRAAEEKARAERKKVRSLSLHTHTCTLPHILSPLLEDGEDLSLLGRNDDSRWKVYQHRQLHSDPGERDVTYTSSL